VGKGSVIRKVLERDPALALSVSVTTRAPRPGEAHGREYLFLSEAEFDRMIADGELLEWAEIVGHRSGTPRAFVDRSLAAGRDVVLEIDVKGAFQVRERVPGATLIFLAPPSMRELEARLRGRGTEDDDRIRTRLATATWEMQQRAGFDHVVVNDDVERAAAEVADIIVASRAADRGDPGDDVP
jgi:guanylate kinase